MADDSVPSVPSRIVTISVVELDETTPATGSVTFTLPCDLYAPADDMIIRAFSQTVQLVKGKAQVHLPCFSDKAVDQDGSPDWAIQVTKSWHPKHPYYIRVPAGSTPISLAKVGSVRLLKGREKAYALTGVGLTIHDGTQASGSATLAGGVLNIDLTIPAGTKGEKGDPGPAGGPLVPDASIELSQLADDTQLYFNVKRFGAKGDGKTDDTATIKAAIAAAGGGTVFFPVGVYVVSDTLVQPDMQTWLGAGMAAVLPGAEKGSCIKAVHGGKAIVAMHRLDGLQVRGPGGVANPQSVGIWSDGSALTLRDVSVAGFATGMSIDNVWYAHLDRVSLMQNSLGLSISNCYNVTADTLRVYAQKDDGTLGTGINVTGGGSIRMTGGSIESYMYGIDLAAGTQAYCDGTYFETKAGTSGAVGIRANGAKITVSVEDCEVYMAGLAWVLFNGSTSGGSLVGRGTKFKSAATADATYAYLWSGGRSVPLVVTIAGDSWENVGTGPIYRTTGSASPGSQISDPTGVTLSSGGTGWTTINGSLELYAGGIRAWNSSRPTGLTSGNAGYFCYNTSSNRIECWTGSGWVNALGQAI